MSTGNDVRLLRAVSVVVVLGIWQFLSSRTTALTLPAPFAVIGAAAQLLVSAPFWKALYLSSQSLVLGYLLASVLGILVGVAVGRGKALQPIFDVYLNILLAVPVAGIIPVIVVGLGIGLAARVAVVLLFSFPIIAVNTAAGIRRPQVALLEMADSFSASRLLAFRRITLPGAVVHIMAGLRLGLGRAVVGMVTSELILLSVGMGNLVTDFASSFHTADLIATLLLMVALGVILMSGVQAAERRLTRWYR